VGAGIAVGGAVYLALQALLRSPELAALTGGLRLIRARAGRAPAKGMADA
jgi:hypothetical protein